MNITKIINQFVTFLNVSHKEIIKLTHNIEINNRNIDLSNQIEHGFYQFMWEIIVEGQLCRKANYTTGDFTAGGYIVPYGDGADFYGDYERVIYPEKLATHKVEVHIGNSIDCFSLQIIFPKKLELIKFVNYNGSIYSVGKPFDFVLCEDYIGNRFLFRLNEVEFFLVELEEDC